MARPRRRKTISIEVIKERANKLLSYNLDDTERAGIVRLLETILLETGNYNGFQDLKWSQGGCNDWVAAGKPEDRESFLGPNYQRVYQ